jgi:hypothetical protein
MEDSQWRDYRWKYREMTDERPPAEWSMMNELKILKVIDKEEKVPPEDPRYYSRVDELTQVLTKELEEETDQFNAAILLQEAEAALTQYGEPEHLEPYFEPEFSRFDLQNLGFAEIYIRLMIDGTTSRSFSARTSLPEIIRR